MKKSVFLCILTLSTCTLFGQWESRIDGIRYFIAADTAIVQSDYSTPYSGDISIPYSISERGYTYTVTSIGSDAFSNCVNLTSISIPNSVKYINTGAFYGCTSLETIQIPNSVIVIGERTFYGCANLTSVNIPNSVQKIGVDAFSNCNSLPVIDNIRYADNYLISAVDKSLSSYAIQNGTKWIEQSAFEGCRNLISIIVPNSVKIIGNVAFRGLVNVEYHGTATGSTWGARYRNGYVEGLAVYNNSNKDTICGYKYNAKGSFMIPDGVKAIRKNTFSGCDSLEYVGIPNTVTSIGDYAFSVCSTLCNITIPPGVTEIGSYAFSCCKRLKSISIPKSVKKIGGYAFYLCDSVETITIGEGVSYIGGYAFEFCKSLLSVTSYAMTPPLLESSIFSGIGHSFPIYVPKGSVSNYEKANYWKDWFFYPIACTETIVDGIQTIVTENSVDITWPAIDGASTYMIRISLGDNIFCSLTFDYQGILLSQTFVAPKCISNQNRQVTIAMQTTIGWKYNIGGLSPGQTYDYTIVTKDSQGGVMNTSSGNFTTAGYTNMDEVNTSTMNKEKVKIIKNGQLYILHDGKMYDTFGGVVK